MHGSVDLSIPGNSSASCNVPNTAYFCQTLHIFQLSPTTPKESRKIMTLKTKINKTEAKTTQTTYICYLHSKSSRQTYHKMFNFRKSKEYTCHMDYIENTRNPGMNENDFVFTNVINNEHVKSIMPQTKHL